MTAPMMVRSSIEDIEEHFDDDFRCQHRDGCVNEVAWHHQFHKCGECLLCDAHTKWWTESVLATIATLGHARCAHCERYFTSLEDMCVVRPV